MGLYLAVFDGEMNELDGIDVGAYSDFGEWRDNIGEKLEKGRVGSRFPLLMLHSDCDGQWTPEQCKSLVAELTTIREEMKQYSPIQWRDCWQAHQFTLLGIVARNLAESFIDIDGEYLFDRVIGLCELAVLSGNPIVLQ